MKAPASTCALDELYNRLGSLHIAGFFRSIASAFDCLSACICAVLALELPIVMSTYGKVMGLLGNLTAASKETERRQIYDRIRGAIDAAGPKGWLEWAIDYRNMLVHRPRRLEKVNIYSTSSLYDSFGRPIIRAKPVPQLIKNPKHTEVEAMKSSSSVILHEPAEVTMEEIFKSSVYAVEEISLELTRVWEYRKANPTTAWAQPAEQWRNDFEGNVTGFEGVSPSPDFFDLPAVTTNPENALRLKAAALALENKGKWPDFDGRGNNQNEKPRKKDK